MVTLFGLLYGGIYEDICGFSSLYHRILTYYLGKTLQTSILCIMESKVEKILNSLTPHQQQQ